jgi:hypothetical protein
VNLPDLEPKDGDFVAYLAELERRQLAGIGAREHPQPEHASAGAGPVVPRKDRPLTRTEAEAVRQRLRAAGKPARDLLTALILALFGTGFIAAALLADGGIVPFVIGAFLMWRALAQLRRALPGSTSPG